jgi:YjbE family integral membrane protein
MIVPWTHDLAALAQVVLIDITLAGDNAVVVGMAVTALPSGQRGRAIALGLAAAAIIRIALGLVALSLLRILGLTLAGGLLLLWVAWKLYRELATPHAADRRRASSSFGAVLLRIIVADLSMSLDNVLAVAGAAGNSRWVLIVGIVFGVALMAIAADLLARVILRQRWIAWVGLALVVFVAIRMIWEGSHQVAAHLR